jgi:hypothetical protein
MCTYLPVGAFLLGSPCAFGQQDSHELAKPSHIRALRAEQRTTISILQTHRAHASLVEDTTFVN